MRSLSHTDHAPASDNTGFLNTLAATWMAIDSRTHLPDVITVLDSDELAAGHCRCWRTPDVVTAAFGVPVIRFLCSIREPVDELYQTGPAE